MFHKGCIVEALSKSDKCPMCRVRSSEDPIQLRSFTLTLELNPEVAGFYESLSDDQKKDIGVLSDQLQAVLKEKQKLVAECEEKEAVVNDQEAEIEDLT